jgi:hypothetical protein
MRSKSFQIVVLIVAILLSACTTKYPTEEVSVYVEPLDLDSIIGRMQADLVSERPIWPDQLDLEDIHEGDILFEVHENSQTRILILKSPYWENGYCKFDTVFWEDNAPVGFFIHNDYCADAGLIEYSKDLLGWNPYNHLIPSGEESLTTEQLEEVISDLKQKPRFEKPLRRESA